MAGVKKPTVTVITPEFRMSYPALLKAKEFIDKGNPTGKFSFQVEGIFDETSLNQFQQYDESTGKYVTVDIVKVLTALTKQAWPNLPPYVFPSEPESTTNPKIDPVVALFKRQQGKGWPLKRGDAIKQTLESKGKKGDQYAGKRVISMKSNKTENVQPPILSMATGASTFRKLLRTVETDMEEARLRFVGGNYAFASIAFVADIVGGVNFLTPYLNSIRYTREGEKFGGQNEMDRFDGVRGGSSDHDPTAGMTADAAQDL